MDLRSDSTLRGDCESEDEERSQRRRENGSLRDGGGMVFGVVGLDMVLFRSFISFKTLFFSTEERGEWRVIQFFEDFGFFDTALSSGKFSDFFEHDV